MCAKHTHPGEMIKLIPEERFGFTICGARSTVDGFTA
jgi:hypothetical protein